MDLVWDYFRKVGTGQALGGCVHYFDTTAQSLYLHGGEIKTKTNEVENGHWKDSVLSSEIGAGNFGYSVIGFDHPHNGTLYGVASDGTNVYFIRYVYLLDLSDMYETGDWQEQVDNQIKSLNLSVKNLSADIFALDNTLFNPGGKVTLQFMAGDSEPYDVGIAYIDDVDFDVYSPSIPVSARNSIGYYLADQSFDDRNSYSGGRSTVLRAILLDAGIDNAKTFIKPDDTVISLLFENQTKILEGINNTLNAIGWRMIELTDGRIIVGDEEYIAGYNFNGRYTYHGGKEVFKRRTSKNADAAYTRVCVTDSENTITVYRNVPYWKYWYMGQRKTKYFTAPEGYTQVQIEAMADSLANELQYVGIGENFIGPIRPQIQVGDVAEIYYEGDTESTSLGIMTQITHHFGGSGFDTDFSLDSGGSATDASSYLITDPVITKTSNALSGYNRKQRITDFIGITAERKASAVYSGGGQVAVKSTMTEAASITAASIIKVL